MEITAKQVIEEREALMEDLANQMNYCAQVQGELSSAMHLLVYLGGWAPADSAASYADEIVKMLERCQVYHARMSRLYK